MKVTVNSKKGLKIDLKVFVDKKTMNVHMSEKYEELKKTVALKGFRPGKVPTEILKKQFGKAIYGEVLDKVLKETSAKALEEQKIKVAGQPKIDLKTFGEEKDLEYTIQVEELPKVGIEQINNIKLINYEVKVSDKDIQKRIDEIAKNQNNFKDKKDDEKSQNGDLVVFDYKATVDDQNFEGGEGKNTQIILGKDLFIKNFDKHLLGIKKNQEVTAEVILPENYPNKKYSNKKAKFFCKILNVKKPEIIKINDEFAKNLGAKDLNDLKILVSKQVRNQYKQTLDLITKSEILNQLDKFKEIEIPKNLINQEVEILSQGMSNEEKEKNKLEHEKSAKKRIKTGLILNELGDKNNIKVNEDEIKREIQKQINTMPGQEKMVMEYYKKNPSAYASLRGGINEDKIISLIKEKAKSQKKSISSDEAEKIIINQNKQSNDTKAVEAKLKKEPAKNKKISNKKAPKPKKVSKK
jgi:trigger factor